MNKRKTVANNAIQTHRRDSSKFMGCRPHQLLNGLISLKPEITYFAYTKRCKQAEKKLYPESKLESENEFYGNRNLE